MLKPDVIEYLIKRCQVELHRRLKEMERQGANSSLDALRRQRHDLSAQAARLAEAVRMGGDLPSLVQSLRSVEAEVMKLDRAIAAYRPRNLNVTDEQVREHILRAMMQLRATLDDGEVTSAKNALLKHVGRLVLTPTLKDDRKVFRVEGSVSLIPEPEECGMLLVARDGIEPPTPAP